MSRSADLRRGTRRRVVRRALVALLLVFGFAALPSCSLFADEFTWLDTAGPVAEEPQQALRRATADRP